jgi:hypothetical protein
VEVNSSEETTSSKEYDEFNDLDPPTPPPAYSEAILSGNELPVCTTRSSFSPSIIGGLYIVDGMEVGLEEWAAHMEAKLCRMLRVGHHHFEQDMASGAHSVANMDDTPVLRVLSPELDPQSRPLAGEFMIVGEDVLPG